MAATDDDIESKLMEYLQTILTLEQMTDVKAILAGEDVQAPQTTAAMDRLRQAEADKASFLKRFPMAERLFR